MNIPFYGNRTPLPKQKAFHKSRAKNRLYYGGLGSGKTEAGCWESLRLLIAFPGTVGLVGRNTYEELRDGTRAAFFKMLSDQVTKIITGKDGNPEDPTDCPLVKSWHRSTNNLVFYTGKQPSILRFRSLDRAEKFKSTEFGFIWLDEGSEADEKAFLFLCGRLRHPAQMRKGKSYHKFFITTNPCNKKHWIYRNFVEGKLSKGADGSFEMFKVNSKENIYLPEGYIDELTLRYDKAWVDRYIHGNFGTIHEGDPIYPMFEENIHIKKVEFNPNLPVYRSWDFGWHHPCVIFAQIDGKKLNILAELEGEKELINDFADKVIKFGRENFKGIGETKFKDFCDPAGKQRGDKSSKTSVEILESKKIFPDCYKANILEGVEMIRILLNLTKRATPYGIFVDKKCEILIEGLKGGYHYPKKYDGTGEEPKPEKDGTYDHLLDALRYLIGNTEFKYWLKRPERKEMILPGTWAYSEGRR